MNAPLIIQERVLHEVLARSIAKRQAAELRAWKRRHLPERVRVWLLVVISIASVLLGLVAMIAIFAAFDL
jgi:hypothetical protein